MKRDKRILLCPLDWGLGHATRCVPVIRELLSAGAEVVIGGDNRPLAFLRQEFHGIAYRRFPGYPFQYPANGSMAASMILSSPAILKGIALEHKRVASIIREEKIDAIISDNRYGLWSKEIPSVFITHQLFIRAPGLLKPLELPVLWLNRFFTGKYSECWIPDRKSGQVLSGELAHKKPVKGNFYYVGPLSRFSGVKKSNGPDLLLLLSGPEPQRTILETILLEQTSDYHGVIVLVRGIPEGQKRPRMRPDIKVFNHLDSVTLEKLIASAGLIVCRPGYSTIMDLSVLGKSAILIPTPGQTEQEYLASYLENKFGFRSIKQGSPEFIHLLHQKPPAVEFAARPDDHAVLRERIANLLNNC